MMIEKQRFTQGWIWIGLIFSLGLMGFVFYVAINKSEDIIWMVYLGFIGLITLSVFLVFLIATLSLRIDEKGISFKFFPFQLYTEKIEWNKIKTASIVKFNPICDFKGWGVRKGRNNEKAYIVKGNIGLKLELNNNKCIIIGIQNEGKISNYIDKQLLRSNITYR